MNDQTLDFIDLKAGEFHQGTVQSAHQFMSEELDLRPQAYALHFREILHQSLKLLRGEIVIQTDFGALWEEVVVGELIKRVEISFDDGVEKETVDLRWNSGQDVSGFIEKILPVLTVDAEKMGMYFSESL